MLWREAVGSNDADDDWAKGPMRDPLSKAHNYPRRRQARHWSESPEQVETVNTQSSQGYFFCPSQLPTYLLIYLPTYLSTYLPTYLQCIALPPTPIIPPTSPPTDHCLAPMHPLLLLHHAPPFISHPTLYGHAQLRSWPCPFPPLPLAIALQAACLLACWLAGFP